MKAISIIQPWAQLLATGEKRFETRHWQTRYRGPIAIHASRLTEDAAALCRLEAYRSLLVKHGYRQLGDLGWGAIIATATLHTCWPTEHPALHDILTYEEIGLGDFSDGRYAWELRDVRLLPAPIPARGKPGLWDFDDALILKGAA